MKPVYGGQAVLEGVMMRGPSDFAVAVRAPSGKIVVHKEELKGTIYTSRLAKLPIIRGMVALWDTMALGMRTLSFSADVAFAEAAAEESGEEAEKPKMPAGVMWGTMVVGLLFAVGLFFVLPVLAMGFVDRFMPTALASNLVEKVIRLTLILGYMFAIGFLPDLRRVYEYHGAEHKSINAYEAGAPLTVESVRRFPTAHPRCGTTFLVIVVLVSFVLFTMLGQPALWLRVASRIVLIPIIAGLAYEIIRLAARNYHRPFVRALMAPGLAVQKLTTREPDDSQLETAIVSLQTVIDSEAARAAEATAMAAPAAEPATVAAA